MGNNQKIVIGDKTLTKEELFKEKEDFRKEQAKLPFEEKIKVLIDLQKIAYSWGEKKDVIVWKK
jgi:hypothetical protein